MSVRLRVDVFFDFICPWCLIGKRQLERARQLLRAERPDVQISTRWHGVQLLPQLPVQGEPFAAFYQNRLGSARAVQLRQTQVQQSASAAGASIDFSRIATMPNTADAHRLLARTSLLGTAAQAEALLEALFSGYFQKGKNLGCRDTLIAIAQSCGYAPADLADCLSGDGSPFVGVDDAQASQGVPNFLIDRRMTLVGAQPAEALLGAMLEALANAPQDALT